jgi:hypothetical protein
VIELRHLHSPLKKVKRATSYSYSLLIFSIQKPPIDGRIGVGRDNISQI